MKQNNKGFSLVELIVVIAIMSILVALSSMTVNTLTGTYPKECAQKVSAQLNATKTVNLSRYDETMKLYKDPSDGCIYTANVSYTVNSRGESKEMFPGSEEVVLVGRESVDVVAHLSDGTQVKITGDMKSITISYNRATGALDPVLVDGADMGDVYVSKLVFSQGRKAFAIEFTKETGRHTLTVTTI